MDLDLQPLIDLATPLVGEIPLGREGLNAATVAAALRTRSGATYTGICIHAACGIGFCAEHAAIAEMLKRRETAIAAIVAVGSGGVLAPCGRCRELMLQVNPSNLNAVVGLPGGRTARLRDLLPEPWM
ncbi:MAG: cytidine deaminase [Bacteroidota bacterium]